MKLTKIKLINWHMFSNVTIDIEGNTLITGENGSGKSTLSDAIFYVLSGGDDKCFNNAANASATRTVESYLRAKLGSDNKEFLRNDMEIIGHIALEFSNEKKKNASVLGVAFELSGGGKAKEKFYYIPDYSIHEEDYISGNVIIDYAAFRSNVKKKFKDNRFIDLSQKNKTERKRAIARDFFQLENTERYNELLRKAIAFRPIDKVSTFVDDFLLKEAPINIETLKEEIRGYSEIKNNLDKEEKKIEFLGDFITKLETFVKNQRALNYYDVLRYELKIQDAEDSIHKSETELVKKTATEQEVSSSLEKIKKDIEDERKTLYALENNDILRALHEKEEKSGDLTIDLQNINKSIENIDLRLEEESRLVRKLNLNYRFRQDIQDGNFPLLKNHFEEYRKIQEDKKAETADALAELRSERKALVKDKEAADKELADLNQGKNTYQEKTTVLIRLIKDEIQKLHKKNIEVRPLCEYLEIKDQTWANAIEGYLNTQRFDLIIDPKYFTDAVEIYEKYKNEKQLFNVGIIRSDMKMFERFIPTPGTLFEKLSIDNKFAEAAAYRILNDVYCVDGVSELTKHEKSITKTCMYYKNKVARNINPKVYEYPFIGKNSVAVRKEKLIQKIDELRKKIDDVDKQLTTLSELNELMSRSNILFLCGIDNEWKNRQVTQDSLYALNIEITEMKKDKSLFAVTSQIDAAKARIRSLGADQRNSENELVNLRAAVQNLKHEIETNAKTKELYISLLADAKAKLTINRDDYERFALSYKEKGRYNTFQLEDEMNHRRNSNNSNISDLMRATSEYVNQYNHSLTADKDCFQSFIDEYYLLKNRNLVEYREKADRALLSAQNSFRGEFISKLYEHIESAQKRIKELNKNLKSNPFGTDEECFEFKYEASDDDELADYYRIIMSGRVLEAKNLFEDELDEVSRAKILNLFDKIVRTDNSPEFERELARYLDYRNYMKYDIVSTNKYRDVTKFSKTSKEKSGGETQTPFYVIIASCFDQLMSKESKTDSTCTVIFDEAFNNMDESRIRSLMDFYAHLNIQLIIVVPTNRMPALAQSVDCIRSLKKINNHIFISKIDNHPEY